MYECTECGKKIHKDKRPEGWITEWKERPEYGGNVFSPVWNCGEHVTGREASVVELDLFR